MTTTTAPPNFHVGAAQRRVALELSQGSRSQTLLLLLGSTMATVLVASLWLTERSLPPRTQVAFGLLTVLGLGWSAFFGWVLTRRELLFAYHRVVAGRLAMLASSLFTGGALLLAVLFPELRATALLAAVFGAGMVLAAGALYTAARRRHADLLQMRGWLEAQLGAV